MEEVKQWFCDYFRRCRWKDLGLSLMMSGTYFEMAKQKIVDVWIFIFHRANIVISLKLVNVGSVQISDHCMASSMSV